MTDKEEEYCAGELTVLKKSTLLASTESPFKALFMKRKNASTDLLKYLIFQALLVTGHLLS